MKNWNWVDWIFAFATLMAIFRGYRAGFLTSVFSALGYIGGGLVGLTVGLHYLHSTGVTKFALLFLAISIGASIFEAILKRIAKVFHNRVLFGPFKWLDSLLGAVFSTLRTLVMLLIVGHLLLITPWGWAKTNIPTSTVYKKLNSYSPAFISEITKKAVSIH